MTCRIKQLTTICSILHYNLPRTILHEVLTTEYDQHIDAAVVEHPCPVLQHPFACALVYEIVLEIKDIRVVWRYTDVHVDHFVAVVGLMEQAEMDGLVWSSHCMCSCC